MADRTVAMEIAVPFAVFLVGKMTESIVMGSFKPFEILFVTGNLICEKCGNEYFVVHPPQLPIARELFGLAAGTVCEINETTKLLIPASLKRPIKNIQSLSEKLLIV